MAVCASWPDERPTFWREKVLIFMAASGRRRSGQSRRNVSSVAAAQRGTVWISTASFECLGNKPCCGDWSESFRPSVGLGQRSAKILESLLQLDLPAQQLLELNFILLLVAERDAGRCSGLSVILLSVVNQLGDF